MFLFYRAAMTPFISYYDNCHSGQGFKYLICIFNKHKKGGYLYVCNI
jgi:hypothetical protein